VQDALDEFGGQGWGMIQQGICQLDGWQGRDIQNEIRWI